MIIFVHIYVYKLPAHVDAHALLEVSGRAKLIDIHMAIMSVLVFQCASDCCLVYKY